MIVTKKYLFVSLWIVIAARIEAHPMIILPLQRPPVVLASTMEVPQTHPAAQRKLARVFEKPLHRVSEMLTRVKTTRPAITNLSGFLAIYNGYMDFSDNDGIIALPIYRHKSREIKLVIASSADLTPPQSNTKFAMVIPATTKNIACYSFKKFRKDDVYYWKVTQDSLPENREIGLDALVLLTEPRNIFVQEGRFTSPKSQHIVFPPNVFIVGTVDQTKILLRSLDIARFFEQIMRHTEYPTDRIKQTIILP